MLKKLPARPTLADLYESLTALVAELERKPATTLELDDVHDALDAISRSLATILGTV